MQGLDDIESVFGSTSVNFETLDSRIADGFLNIMNSKFVREVQVTRELQEENNLSMLTARQIACMIYGC